MKFKNAILGSITLMGTILVFPELAAENEVPTIEVEADKIIDVTTSTLNFVYF